LEERGHATANSCTGGCSRKRPPPSDGRERSTIYGLWSERDPFPDDPVDAEALHTDPMTGLENLFGCLKRLQRELEEPRDDTSRLTYLTLADVDQLTDVNERSGRVTGDEILMLARATLLDVSRDQDSVYRFSRDEFAMLGRASWEEAEDLAQRAVKKFAGRARDITAAGQPPATLSAGLAVTGEGPPPSVGELIFAASTALHGSKIRGGGSVTVLPVAARKPGERESPPAELLTLFSRRILDTLNIAVDAGEMALTDPLTSLPNHRAAVLHLRRKLPELLAEDPPFSLLLADGDSLKKYNERFGYAAGNEMIVSLARILTEGKREEDFLARWFVGDEFLLVLPGADRCAAARAAERLRRTVQEKTAEWQIPVTISIGTATAPNDGKKMEQLLHLAQEACAAAKRRGKNCVVQHPADGT